MGTFTYEAMNSVGQPVKGEVEATTSEDAIAKVRAKVDGLIAWSSSRIGNHDIFLMKTDCTGVRQVTKGAHVDWYPRFSRDGARILFIRSKKGWVSEKDANRPEKWDLFTMNSAKGFSYGFGLSWRTDQE